MIGHSKFVESLKRLYGTRKIDSDKVIDLKDTGKITEEECLYIMGV